MDVKIAYQLKSQKYANWNGGPHLEVDTDNYKVEKENPLNGYGKQEDLDLDL